MVRRKDSIYLFLLILLFLPSYSAAKPLNIAVFQFSGNGFTNNELQSLTERLRVHLSENAEFNVLERDRMEDILREQGLQQSGCTEAECAVKAGQLLNVQFIIIGVATSNGDLKTLLLRMISVSTGKIERAAVLDCEQCPIEKLLKEKVKEIAEDIAIKASAHPVDQETSDFLSLGKQFIDAIDSRNYDKAYDFQSPDDKKAMTRAEFIEIVEAQRSGQIYLPPKDTKRYLTMDVPTETELQDINLTLRASRYDYKNISSIRIMTELGWRPDYLKCTSLRDSNLANDKIITILKSSMIFTSLRKVILLQIDSTQFVFTGALAKHVQDSVMKQYNEYLRQKVILTPKLIHSFCRENDTVQTGDFIFSILNKTKDTLLLSDCFWKINLIEVGKSISYHPGTRPSGYLLPGQQILDSEDLMDTLIYTSRATINKWSNKYGNWVEYNLQKPTITYNLDFEIAKTSSPVYKLTGFRFLVPWGLGRYMLNTEKPSRN